MTTNPSKFILPADRSTDVLGRQYSQIIGYPKDPLIPLGSVVILMPGSGVSSIFDKHNVGRRSIVLEHGTYRPWSRDEPMVLVHHLSNLDDWEPWQNRQKCIPQFLFIEKLGDGKVPVPGTDYQLSLKERYDAKWKVTDHQYQGWSNPATFLAHVYLRTDARHYEQVRSMRRANGTVNPVRLQNYFSKQRDLSIDDWAQHHELFPERSEYSYRPNWAEVAQEFNAVFKEQDAHELVT